MALSPANESAKKLLIKNSFILAILALFLKYFSGFSLLALEKAECFEDNSFSSLLNFNGGKYFKSAL